MEPQARYTLVGAVTLALGLLTALTLLWLERRSGEPVKMYTIYFRTHSLGGLQPDGDVTMRGIRVGRIRSLRIAGDPERVKVTIEVRASTPVKIDSKAVVERNLLTGLASIDIIGSTRASRALVLVPPGEEHPVIPEGPARIEELKKDLPELLAKGGELVTRASDLLSEKNRESVRRTIANLERISTLLASPERGIGRTLDDIHGVANDLRKTATRLDAAVTKAAGKPLEELLALATELRHLAATVDSSLRQVVATQTSTIARIAEDIGRSASALSTTLETFADPGELLVPPSPPDLGPGEAKKP